MKTTALNAETPRNFNVRYLSIFICLFWVGALFLLLAASWSYDSYQSSQIEERLRPSSIVPVIVKDLLEFKSKYNRFPEDLNEFVALSKAWTLNKQKQSRVFYPLKVIQGTNTGAITTKGAASLQTANEKLTAVRFRNYTYLYAKIDIDTAVLWALPESIIPPGYKESAGEEKASLAEGYAANFRQTSNSYFLVVNGNRIRQFSGKTGGQITLEKAVNLLQPSPAQLFELGMLERIAKN
jgi:hypothetical protein